MSGPAIKPVRHQPVPANSELPEAQAESALGTQALDQPRFLTVTRAVADERRLQVLRVLHQESFGVLELCDMLQLAQPALSHHLKTLHKAGLVAKRREGNSIYYRRASDTRSPLHAALFSAIDALPLDTQIQARIAAVQEHRRTQSQAFFATHAREFANQQARICQSSVYGAITLDLLLRHTQGRARALEVGPGDGALTLALGGEFDTVLAIDSSSEMLSQTRQNIGEQPNITLRRQDVANLGKSRKFDSIVACMVLHHLPSPASFFQQARQLLKTNGTLLIAELCPHDQQWAQSACGDLWLGFATQDLTDWATHAGFSLTESQFLAQRNGFQIQILALT